MTRARLIPAIKASGVHLLLSIVVCVTAAAFVFGIWYPFPYRELMGGRELFLLVIAVDVVCGPLLTLVFYNPAKPHRELSRDMGLVAAVQLAALVYGLHTVMLVRPVYLVFEVDRFNAISAVDVDESALDKAKKPWDALPLWGPKIIASRPPKDNDEMIKSIDLSMQGIEPSARPNWWQALDVSRVEILKRAKPLPELRRKHGGNLTAIARLETAIKNSGKVEDELRWLPLTSRRSKDWTVLIDVHTARPLAYAAIDGF
jgi:uncharacterized membrane protein